MLPCRALRSVGTVPIDVDLVGVLFGQIHLFNKID
jgi:hypothetical protein